jgi:predicted DNA-binding helix-hairpin-helix protein
MGIQDRDYMRGKAAEGESRLEFPEFRSKWWRRINIRTTLAIAVAAITVISGAVWLVRDAKPLFAHSAPEKGSLVVNINTATLEQLETLPGIGPARARLIIEHRTYSSVDDLKRVKSIPGNVIEDLRPLVLVNGETQERARK